MKKKLLLILGCIILHGSVNAMNRHQRRAAERLAAKVTKPRVSLNVNFHDTVMKGDVASVRSLLETGANVDLLDEYGSTPLHIAAMIGNHAIAKLLIDYRASIDIQNGGGDTPLHFAAQFGHQAVVRLLLDHDANMHLMEKYGATPVTTARDLGHQAVLRMLQDHFTSSSVSHEQLRVLEAAK